jgi:hypothetical protein
MGTVYKKIVTKPLPAGAKVIVRKIQPFERTDVSDDYLGPELVKIKTKIIDGNLFTERRIP